MIRINSLQNFILKNLIISALFWLNLSGLLAQNLEEKIPSELNKKEAESNVIKGYSNSISAAARGLEKVVNITFGIVQMPLKIGGGIVLMLLMFFLYLIH